VVSRDSADRLGRYAQAAQAESHCAFSDFCTLAVACCPLPFGARPHDALNGLRPTHGVDVVERALCQTSPDLVDEWLEHRGVGRLYQLRGRETLRLRLKGHAAQVRFDVLAECEVESSVDPGGNGIDWVGCCYHPPSQPSLFSSCHL